MDYRLMAEPCKHPAENLVKIWGWTSLILLAQCHAYSQGNIRKFEVHVDRLHAPIDDLLIGHINLISCFLDPPSIFLEILKATTTWPPCLLDQPAAFSYFSSTNSSPSIWCQQNKELPPISEGSPLLPRLSILCVLIQSWNKHRARWNQWHI